MRKLHLTLGFAVMLVFLATGAYMKFRAHPDRLPDGAHMMFVSRHIYILANALVQLALAAHVAPLPGSRRRVQWAGSALLAVSGVLLVAAFVLEPIAGAPRSFASTFGLYTLFAGTLLHVAASLRQRAGA